MVVLEELPDEVPEAVAAKFSKPSAASVRFIERVRGVAHAAARWTTRCFRRM